MLDASVEQVLYYSRGIALLQQVEGQTVVQAIIDRIAGALMNGELHPGDRLPPEPDMAANLGVSRTALREATKTLCGLGVLRARRRGGTFVAAQFSPRMLDPLIFGLIIERGSPDELYELRVLLEVDAVELAIKKASAADFEKLEVRLAAFADLIPAGNLEALNQEDMAFHCTLLEIGGNPSFARVAMAVMQLFAQPMRVALRSMGPEKALNNHRLLLEAIRARDLLEAERLIELAFRESRAHL